jgi:GT2 family glycosyltransferase
MKQLSIILVNWNCLAYTEEAIASILETTRNVDYEVIVVDNDSADAPCRSLAVRFPWIRLVLSKDNIGFGRANNLGVSMSTGQYLLFLNPDTLILNDALQRMISALEAYPRGGAIGCRLFNRDGSLQTSCVQTFPTILNQLLALSWLQRRLPALRLWGKQPLYSTVPHTVHEVEVVSGAAIMVKRDVFESVGGFHPDYFMFAEEVDLCYSIQRAEWKVLHQGDAHIMHFGGQSTKGCEDTFATVTMRDSIFRFLRRRRGNVYAAMYRFALFLSAFCRIMLLTCLLPFTVVFRYPGQPQAIQRTIHKWHKIAQWAMGLQASRQDRRKAPASTKAAVKS